MVNVAGPQDRTRYELTRHLYLHGSVQVERGLFDRATYHGRTYSDKAPGMSFAALPGFAVERAAGFARAPRDWHSEGDLSLWLARVLVSGYFFLAMIAVVGRLAGLPAAAILGVATIAGPLAPTFFEHDAAAALGIAAFGLATRRRLALAGLAAGAAVCFEYATGLVVVAVGVYACVRFGRSAWRYAAGVVPGTLALGAYDLAAFGSPFHLSYRYVANPFTERQHHGFFGIGIPSAHGLWLTLVGTRGLLLVSPVCVAAAIGLVLLWRRGQRLEAATAGAITIAFVLVDAGYFLPYGGTSPGPRFLVPALPFLALGLPPALERFRAVTLALAGISAVLIAADSLTWSLRGPSDTGLLPSRADLAETVGSWATGNRNVGAALVVACALAALAAAVRSERA